MVSLVKKYPRITSVLFGVALSIVLLGIIELILKLFFPFTIATFGHGHRYSKNGIQYGWGFSPGELQWLLDPDTGEIFIEPANNHGWRDKDRQYDNPDNAYRILVLGDSVTYGMIVPAHKVYTRILEEELNNNAYNVEVINIAYRGWGTEQQLEALVHEGVKYKPNLIIVQFCINDIPDNAYYYHAVNKKEKQWRRDKKPFYYELDQNNVVHRRENPYFDKYNAKTLKKRIIRILHYSEILKRIHAVYFNYRLREQYNFISPDVNKDIESGFKYRVTENQLLQLQTVIGLSEDSRLYKFLHDHIGKRLSFEDLTNAIESSAFFDKKKIIYRILEDRWFNKKWSVRHFRPDHADAASYEWKLYFALIDEIKKHARLIDADLAIFPETEEGRYQWSLSWHRVSGDERSKINYLSHIQVIKSAMKEKGIDVIENTIPYQRARNDNHPNSEGNQSMADDIFRYLMLRKDELEEYRNLTNR
jgi:lysophospholipase L1-like esterase